MNDFLARCKTVMSVMDRSAATVSKKLFGNPHTLPNLLDPESSVSPRFQTLLDAREKLEALEGEIGLDTEAA